MRSDSCQLTESKLFSMFVLKLEKLVFGGL